METVLQRGKIGMLEACHIVAEGYYKRIDHMIDVKETVERLRNAWRAMVQAGILERADNPVRIDMPTCKAVSNSVSVAVNPLKNEASGSLLSAAYRKQSAAVSTSTTPATPTRKRGRSAKSSTVQHEAKVLKTTKRSSVKDTEELEEQSSIASSLAAPVLEDGQWRAAFNSLNKAYRRTMIARAIGEKLNATCGLLMQKIMEACERSPNGLVKKSTIESFDVGVAADKLPVYLDLLAREPDYFIRRVSDVQSGLYAIDMEGLVEWAQMRIVDSIVMDRYGDSSHRIFRLLHMKGYQEQKQISDNALEPVKESREGLYALMVAGYIKLQEVPRSADQQASRTIYLWGVDKSAVIARVACDVLKGIHNMYTRVIDMDDPILREASVEATRFAGAMLRCADTVAHFLWF